MRIIKVIKKKKKNQKVLKLPVTRMSNEEVRGQQHQRFDCFLSKYDKIQTK